MLYYLLTKVSIWFTVCPYIYFIIWTGHILTTLIKSWVMLLAHYICRETSCSKSVSCPRSHGKHKACFHSVFKRSSKPNTVLRSYSLSMSETFLQIRPTLGDNRETEYKLITKWKFNNILKEWLSWAEEE